jgi:hypothetical protein
VVASFDINIKTCIMVIWIGDTEPFLKRVNPMGLADLLTDRIILLWHNQ